MYTSQRSMAANFGLAVEKGLSESLVVNKANRQSPVGNNIEIFSTRTYSLNINKALQNKLNSCDTVRVEYEVTDGGITGCMDTETFELIRLACSAFYDTLPVTEGRSIKEVSEDKNKKAVVQQIY